MHYGKFEGRWAEFCAELYRRLARESEHIWTRHSEEAYDHKRTREFAVWRGDGDQEKGHVFLARSMEWDGEVNWERVMEICEDDNLALGYLDQSKVWNLAQLETQLEPSERCGRCGKLGPTW